jgi:hypothetical protein
MKLRSHSGMNDRISQGSSRSLALYCLGSRETQREASVTRRACRPARRRKTMQQLDSITKLEGLADHARLSHAHWLREARKGGIGKYGPAYCIEGAGVWRRRLGELLTQIRNAEPAR